MLAKTDSSGSLRYVVIPEGLRYDVSQKEIRSLKELGSFSKTKYLFVIQQGINGFGRWHVTRCRDTSSRVSVKIE